MKFSPFLGGLIGTIYTIFATLIISFAIIFGGIGYFIGIKRNKKHYWIIWTINGGLIGYGAASAWFWFFL